MNRREFSVGAACTLALAGLGLPGSLLAQVRKPEEGTDYLTLGKAIPVEAPVGKIEVIEFFWYSCPHCNAFEPKLVNWIKKLPGDVSLRRVPVAFRDDFVPQQRLFYTLEAMGKLEDLHGKVFTTIHAERNMIDKEPAIAAWVEKNGVDRAKFQEIYNSFSVQTKARRATQLQDAYKVQGVPAIGVAGRWYTDGTIAGSMDRALQVTDYLVAEARKTAK